MQNSPQLGDNHVVNPKIERNANTFSMSSIKVYHEPKAKDLHTYQAEKIDHGLMAKDLHAYQTEKYRKRHVSGLIYISLTMIDLLRIDYLPSDS